MTLDGGKEVEIPCFNKEDCPHKSREVVGKQVVCLKPTMRFDAGIFPMPVPTPNYCLRRQLEDSDEEVLGDR